MHGTHNTCWNAGILSAKNAYALVYVRLCNSAEASLPWDIFRTYLESCASIVQAVICSPPRFDEISRRCCSLKESVWVHASSWRGCLCSVAQASFDHLRWCRPHPVCLWVALEAWPRSPPITEIYFHLFFLGVFIKNKHTDWFWMPQASTEQKWDFKVIHDWLDKTWFDWCCFNYSIKKNLVALLEALFVRIFLKFEMSLGVLTFLCFLC